MPFDRERMKKRAGELAAKGVLFLLAFDGVWFLVHWDSVIRTSTFVVLTF
jgi:hypothetical protein